MDDVTMIIKKDYRNSEQLMWEYASFLWFDLTGAVRTDSDKKLIKTW
jgi:hypothetical protein